VCFREGRSIVGFISGFAIESDFKNVVGER